VERTHASLRKNAMRMLRVVASNVKVLRQRDVQAQQPGRERPWFAHANTVCRFPITELYEARISSEVLSERGKQAICRVEMLRLQQRKCVWGGALPEEVPRTCRSAKRRMTFGKEGDRKLGE